jgi:hypothetical protein
MHAGAQDVIDGLLCNDEGSVSTWGESPNAHMGETSRVLELGLQFQACSNVDFSHAESSSDYQDIFSTFSPAELPCSLALACAPPPAETTDTEFVDTFR